ncbi:hypothetical protein [Methylobacterium sp. WL6]|uniref:hypothetical protein n=1 Tax=Methylobacterium sp. WL6 TaxID=2603901 RepID=UPI0011C7F36C|nr:hypothetical protein [Methylobacterium sp. WL6]TXN64984.1 hypothetical protein FV230_17565 [Methylobacterium sp. WL6]
MIPIWPSDLPQRFLRDGFGRTLADGRLSTKMERGPSKRRRGSSAAVAPVTGAMDLPVDLAARFERFWDEDTGGGCLPFLLPDQILDGLPLLAAPGVPLLDASGLPIVAASWWLAMFSGDQAPSIKNVAGAFYRVSFQIEVLP